MKPLFVIDNQKITNRRIIANKFNDYFVSLASNLNKSNLNKLYHTLFESDLVYGITVWGGIAQNKLNPIFVTQKMCLRILFGNKAAYLDKFKTCVRT